MDLTRRLLDQFDWHWGIVRERLDDLTDDEYLWEPVEHCWSLRHRDEARSPAPAGAGEIVMDRGPDVPAPPVTTIAWRLAHIAIDVFGARASNHFGDGTVTIETTDLPITAAGGLELVELHYARWRDGAGALDADGLMRPVGPAEGPFAEDPYLELILHLNREALHHTAEVLLLRDLYRTSFRPPTRTAPPKPPARPS
jgi:hypothetical protein